MTKPKRFCHEQEKIIQNHVSICEICKASFDEYIKRRKTNLPPCKGFKERLENHIKYCPECKEIKNN